jgi:exonuclease III
MLNLTTVLTKLKQLLNFYIISLCNTNGLTQHTPTELKTFISIHNIAVMLISETQVTERSYLKLPTYTVHNTNHPAGTARGGTAIIIKKYIKHHQLNNWSQDFLQTASVSMENSVSLLTISAVYLPPKYKAKQEQLEEFYNSLRCRFMAGGDYNAKHTDWGSRLITPRGCKVLKTMERNNLKHLSTGEPTYWPSDRNKLPDVVDFVLQRLFPKTSL